MTTERKSYSSNKFQLELPYLIEVQKASYEQFLQKEIPQEKRLKVGLERVFQDIFPITDVKGLYSLKYEGYYFGITDNLFNEPSDEYKLNSVNSVKFTSWNRAIKDNDSSVIGSFFLIF